MDLRNKPTTADSVTRVSVEAPEGSRVTLVSPDWADKTTWYFKSTRNAGVTLTDSGDGLRFDIDPDGYAVTIIDNYHGKYSDEDFLKTVDGYLPRAKAYVDGYEKTEQDPHYGNGGDYLVNYRDGYVTFLQSQAGKTVTMDYWEVGTSCWTIKPVAGKKLKLISAEVQFSENISVRDTVIFQPYGFVDVFAPHLVGPIPSGTLIPLGDPTIYKSMMDYINEANGALPVIPKTTTSNPTWRDLKFNIETYPWHYQALTELKSSYGMEVRITLQHHEEFSGYATATFYCLSYNDA